MERRQAKNYQRGREKLTAEQKLRRKLTEEAGGLCRRRHRQMKAKHGESSPHLRAGAGGRRRVLHHRPAADKLKRWRAWGELEKIVFGGPLPETEERITEYEETAAAEGAERQRREAERREQNPYSAGRPAQWVG